MTPQELLNRLERHRAQIASWPEPAFYGTTVRSLKKIVDGVLSLFREHVWLTDELAKRIDALESAARTKPESNP